ncbi:hypothetical protein BZA77DRAFT_318706 [Pyronema omphalodes]|nr:hypothetical protein BZA77DRAFT_330611 [Pyronema omphalodes]KAI5814371.1 hypothetical protein BZA77DRAFT_318706 [Pyronema omphalodes]
MRSPHPNLSCTVLLGCLSGIQGVGPSCLTRWSLIPKRSGRYIAVVMRYRCALTLLVRGNNSGILMAQWCPSGRSDDVDSLVVLFCIFAYTFRPCYGEVHRPLSVISKTM